MKNVFESRFVVKALQGPEHGDGMDDRPYWTAVVSEPPGVAHVWGKKNEAAIFATEMDAMMVSRLATRDGFPCAIEELDEDVSGILNQGADESLADAARRVVRERLEAQDLLLGIGRLVDQHVEDGESLLDAVRRTAALARRASAAGRPIRPKNA
jgi:hypothetical protein